MSDADAGEVQRSALADFAVISVDGFKPTNAVMLIRRKNGYLGPVCRRLMDFVTREF